MGWAGMMIAKGGNNSSGLTDTEVGFCSMFT